MTENLFLIGSGNDLKTLTSTTFVTESEFQELLAIHPGLLTSADFGETSPRRWMLVRREAGVPDAESSPDRWYLDHLFLDQDGVPTLVEVKRATNDETRRKVVAQMLDYAANAASYWRVEDVENWFRKRCEEEGSNPLDQLRTLLQLDSPDAEAFWRGVQANLSSGRIRLIFVADRIPPELQRIVEFLNEQMNPATVLALELRPFTSGAERILSPRLIGLTSRAIDQKRATSSQEQLSPEGVEGWFSKILNASQRAKPVRRLIEMARALGANVTVANSYLNIKFTARNGPVRALQVTNTGRLSICNGDLKKAGAYASKIEIEHLWSELHTAGFATPPNPEEKWSCAIDLPEVEDERRWTALKKIQEEIARKLNPNTLTA